MTRLEIETELGALRAKPSLLASEQRRFDYLETRLAELAQDDGVEHVRALLREHMRREAEIRGYAPEDDEEGAPAWRP